MTSTTGTWTSGKRRALIAAGLLLAAVYVAAALFTDRARLNDALRQLGSLGCMAVLGLSMVNYLLRFYRWQHYLDQLGRSLPTGRHLLIYLSGFAFTVSPAKAGEAVRSMYLREHGVTYGESIAALFVERILDLLVIIAMACILVIHRPTYRPLVLLIAGLSALMVIAVCQRIVPSWIEQAALRFKGRVSRALNELAVLLRSSRKLLHPRVLALGLATGLLAWAAEGVGLYLVCGGLHITGSAANFVGIYALAVLAGSAAFFLPAGIGGMEVAMVSLLIEQGAETRVAIVATLLCRLATLWFAVLLGVGAAVAIEVCDRRLRARLAP